MFQPHHLLQTPHVGGRSFSSCLSELLASQLERALFSAQFSNLLANRLAKIHADAGQLTIIFLTRSKGIFLEDSFTTTLFGGDQWRLGRYNLAR